MKVILLQDVKSLGKKGEIVDAHPEYGSGSEAGFSSCQAPD